MFREAEKVLGWTERSRLSSRLRRFVNTATDVLPSREEIKRNRAQSRCSFCKSSWCPYSALFTSRLRRLGGSKNAWFQAEMLSIKKKWWCKKFPNGWLSQELRAGECVAWGSQMMPSYSTSLLVCFALWGRALAMTIGNFNNNKLITSDRNKRVAIWSWKQMADNLTQEQHKNSAP